MKESILYQRMSVRVNERFEDGTVIFTNEEQNTPFKIRIQANPITSNVSFTFAINGGSNSDHLKYSQFLKAARSIGRLKVHHLNSGNNLLEANCSEAESSEYMERLDSEIAFLENIVALENYFGIRIDVPERFAPDEVDLVRYVAAIVQGEEICGGWSRYEMNMTIAPQTKQNLTESSEKPYSLTYVGSATVDIFGNSLTYPCMRTLLSAKLENPSKIVRLLEILEEGEEMPVVFIPGEETGVGKYVDKLGVNY